MLIYFDSSWLLILPSMNDVAEWAGNFGIYTSLGWNYGSSFRQCGEFCFPNLSIFFLSFLECRISWKFFICLIPLYLQCELDIMFHLEKAHFMLEEMVMNGCIVETSKSNILTPIQLMDKTSWRIKKNTLWLMYH